jgi:phospholipase C
MNRIILASSCFALAVTGTLLGYGCGSSEGTTASDAGHGDSKAPDAEMHDVSSPDVNAADGGQLALARSKIKHVIIINQENRSLDHYFGTFPGVDGIPMDGGVPTVCSIVPDGGGCTKPFHNRKDENSGGPHSSTAFSTCVADGGMNGFIESVVQGSKKKCKGMNDPNCSLSAIDDVMGYHDEGEIPNYWAYAKAFTLQDHLFEPVASYSLPDHLYMVSAWAALCTPPDDPTACTSNLTNPGNGAHLSFPGNKLVPPDPEYAWTDVTFILHQHGVTWNYFVAGGTEPDCDDGEMTCEAGTQNYTFPSYWNVLPWFDDVKADKEVGNVADTSEFFDNLKNGKLAAVNWLIPSNELSEHPTALVSAGQAYVTGIINAVMESPYWDSSVIFLTWDDWGGFYDHLNPLPDKVDQNGYGIRVPGMTISPWVKPHVIDHQVYSHDAYLRFIEDLFADSERLNPKSDGRPDDRPTVRETVPLLSDLLSEFDFTQTPNPTLILKPCPTGVDTIFPDSGSPCSP